MTPQERREKGRIYMANRRAGSAEVREKCRAYSRAYIASHREERSAYSKKYRLKRDYGMTWEDFTAMLERQDGKCAICGVKMDPPARCTKDSTAVTVDHCHTTGNVRGLLCYSCNLGLGIFKDNLNRLRAAVAYLESSESSPPPVNAYPLFNSMEVKP